MTDTTAGKRGGVGIRLYVEGGALVRRTFDQVADSGKKMWSQIALGEKSGNPAIRALSIGVGEAKSGFEGLANRAGMAGSALGAFGFAGVALAAVLGTVAMAASAAFTAMGDAAALVDTAELLGVTAERLQEWRYVADEAGVETAKFESNLEKLNGMLGKFKLGIGDGKLKPVFEELGITKEQLQDIENADQLMDLLADTLGQVQDRAKQVALAKALGVEEMLPALRLGSEELGRLRDEAHDLGLVLNQETVAALDEADRQMERAGQQMRIIRDTAVAPLAGAFADVTSKIAETSVEIANMTSQLPSWSQALVQFMTKLPIIGLPIKGYLAGLAKTGIGPSGQEAEVAQGSTSSNGKAVAGGGFELAGHSEGRGSGGLNRGEADRLKREEDQRNQRILRAQERIARANDEVLRAYDRQSNMSIDGRAAYEVAELERERAARLREIARDEEEYKTSNGLRGLSEAEAEQLKLKQQELHDTRAAAIEWERRRDQASRRLRDEEEAGRAAIDILDIESQMARTARERYRIEREILLATQALARKRKAQELENDPELDTDERQRRMDEYDYGQKRQVDLLDDREHQRMLEQFKGYGREVVQAMKDGRIGEYIGERIQERLLDAALEQLFQLFEMAKSNRGSGGVGSGGFWSMFSGRQSGGWPFSGPYGGTGAGSEKWDPSSGGGGWMSSMFSSVASLFGGPRASGGGTRAGQFYTTVEHGRPELLMIGGTGHVTSAAETARMLQDLTDPQIYGGGSTTLQQRNVFDFKGAVVTQDLIDQANATAKSAAQNAFDGAREVVPSDRARQDRYTRGRRS